MTRFFLPLLVILGLGACSEQSVEPELPKGKCIVNEDCPQGKRCMEERCRDIYFPQLDNLRERY